MLIQNLGGTSWILLPDDSEYPEFAHWVKVFAHRAVSQAVPSAFPVPLCAQDGSRAAAVAGQSPGSLSPHEAWSFSLLISHIICKSQISPSRNKTPSLGGGFQSCPTTGLTPGLLVLSGSSIPLEATRSSLRPWRSCPLQ